MEDPVVPLERNLYGPSFGRTIAGKANGESPIEILGRRFPIGNAYSYTVKEGYSYLCMWMTSNWLERNKILNRCGKYSTKKLIWENQHLSSIMKTWCVLKDNVKQAKILLTITEPCLNPEFAQEQLKNYHARKICVFLCGPTTWKVMPRNAWKDIANWRTKKQLNSKNKVATPCIDDHQCREEELGSVGELSKVCSQIVLTCLYLARIGRPYILWCVNKLARAETIWTKSL